jgi:hypothetical protein
MPASTPIPVAAASLRTSAPDPISRHAGEQRFHVSCDEAALRHDDLWNVAQGLASAAGRSWASVTSLSPAVRSGARR